MMKRTLLLVLGLGVAASAQDPRAAYLDELAQAARAMAPDGRALPLAQVALANARADRADVAFTLAHAAVERVNGSDRYAVEAIARAGAAIERAGGDGTVLLSAALDLTKRATGAERTRGLVAWLGALVEAPAPDPAFLERALAMLPALPSEQQAIVVKDALPSLQRLGAERQAAALASQLLRSRLRLLFLPDVVAALEALGGLPEGGAAVVWEKLESAPGEIDEFAVPCMIVALRGEPDPWAVSVARADGLRERGHAYAALLVQLAGVFRVTEDRHPSAGGRLEETLEAAWRFPRGHDPSRTSTTSDDDALQRVRVLYRLIPRIPEACAPERAAALLARELDRAVARERHPYVVNELLGHVAKAAEKLGAGGGGPIVAGVLERALAEHRAATELPAVLFEALAECARVAGALGDRERGLAVVDQVAARANEAIAALPATARDRSLGGPVFFPATALFACARAARRLGDAPRADACFDAGLAAVGGLDVGDRSDLLVDAFSTAADATGEARWALARRVVRALGRSGHESAPWQLHELFAAAAAVVE